MITPVALTVATEVLLLPHEPPAEVSLSVTWEPTHTLLRPVTAPGAGNGFIVIGHAATAVPQLLVTVYFMVSVPAALPVTTPPALTPASAYTELQVPPAVPVASVRVIWEPAQTVDRPLMAPALGIGLTVTTCVVAIVPQLLVTVYDIVVLPTVTGVTTPVALTVATAAAVLSHVPPEDVSVRVSREPIHTVLPPLITPDAGSGLTVTTCVATEDPQALETVYLTVSVPALTPVTTPAMDTDAMAG